MESVTRLELCEIKTAVIMHLYLQLAYMYFTNHFLAIFILLLLLMFVCCRFRRPHVNAVMNFVKN